MMAPQVAPRRKRKEWWCVRALERAEALAGDIDLLLFYASLIVTTSVAPTNAEREQQLLAYILQSRAVSVRVMEHLPRLDWVRPTVASANTLCGTALGILFVHTLLVRFISHRRIDHATAAVLLNMGTRVERQFRFVLDQVHLEL